METDQFKWLGIWWLYLYNYLIFWKWEWDIWSKIFIQFPGIHGNGNTQSPLLYVALCLNDFWSAVFESAARFTQFQNAKGSTFIHFFFHFIGVHLSARDYCTEDSWGEFKIYNILLLKSPSLSLPPSRKFRQHHACIRVKRSCMWPSQGHQLRGGRLTSLDASFIQCFVFCQTYIVKNIEVNVFKISHR